MPESISTSDRPQTQMRSKPSAPEAGTTDDNLGAFDTHALIDLLFRKAQANLSRDELQWIEEGASDTAAFHTRNLAQVMTTLGCMVNSDKSNYLQDSESLSKLLFTMAHQTQVIAELVDAGESARCWLKG